MNLHQLRALLEVMRQGLSVSAAAKALHASQPGVSRQILELERELEVEIFVRDRNRLIGVTEPGSRLIEIARRVLQDTDSMYNIARDHGHSGIGSLTIATTHTHAYYTLPQVVRRFSDRYPRVQLRLREATPHGCLEALGSSEADVAIVTESAKVHSQIAQLPAYRLSRCIAVPVGHPLLRVRSLTIRALASHPLIAYDPSFSSRRAIDLAFSQEGLQPTIALTVIDADVGKRYAALGLGVALLPTIAFDAKVDRKLRIRRIDHLVEQSTVFVCVRKNSYLRTHLCTFIAMFAPHVASHIASGRISSESSMAAFPAQHIPVLGL